MYNTLAHDPNSIECGERLTERSRPEAPAGRDKHPRRRGLLTAIVTAVAFALVPAVADAQTLNNVAVWTGTSGYYQEVLDISGASAAVGAPLIQWASNNGANQRWNFVPDANGYEHIVNVNSGLCLATDGVAGDWISQWPCSNNTEEDWAGTLDQHAGKALRNPRSGLYLDVDNSSGYDWLQGTHLIGWYYNGDLNQLFTYGQY
jgi:hypothetical protein